MITVRFTRWDCRQGSARAEVKQVAVALLKPKWEPGFLVSAQQRGLQPVLVRLAPSARIAAVPGLEVRRLVTGALEVTVDPRALEACPAAGPKSKPGPKPKPKPKSKPGPKPKPKPKPRPKPGPRELRPKTSRMRDIVREALEQGPQSGAALADLGVKAGISDRAAQRAIRGLLDEGFIEQAGSAFPRHDRRRGRISPIYRRPGDDTQAPGSCEEALEALLVALGEGATSAELTAATGLGITTLKRLLQGVAVLTEERRGRGRIWRPGTGGTGGQVS